MTSRTAAGKPRLIAEVLAERCDLRLRLYQIGTAYHIRAQGMGWAPGRWADHGKAFAKLLDCQTYGPVEADMLRCMCKGNP